MSAAHDPEEAAWAALQAAHEADPEYVTIQQIAVMSHLAVDTIRHYRCTGKGGLPPGFKRGRRVLYRKEDIVRWIEGGAE